jgi:hypothetical protein
MAKKPEQKKVEMPPTICPVCEGSGGFVMVKVMRQGKFYEVAAKCKHGGE